MISATGYAMFYRNIFGSEPFTTMKAKVYVTLKPSVLDPQGKAIKHSVQLLGFESVNDIRQGKYFEIALGNDVTQENARAEATRLAHEVLSNPIIEDFRVEIEE
jgi:phosphoribosylformylglycinamidine synthase subunit PurS